jgi:hypothetical protein
MLSTLIIPVMKAFRQLLGWSRTIIHTGPTTFPQQKLPTTSIRVNSSNVQTPAHRYVLGGYHPVRLGDKFEDRYVVLRKVGFGRYSTVWLAKDMRYRTRIPGGLIATV